MPPMGCWESLGLVAMQLPALVCNDAAARGRLVTTEAKAVRTAIELAHCGAVSAHLVGLHGDLGLVGRGLVTIAARVGLRDCRCAISLNGSKSLETEGNRP